MKPDVVVDASLIGNLQSYDDLKGDLGQTTVGDWTKRSFDVVGAFGGLIIFLPLMIFLAAAIWLHDRKSPFFAHSRLGRDGRVFKCLKFRSMVPNAALALATLLASDPAACLEWDETQKLQNDPRITPLGKLLRASSLDELPQLINVLKGEMSIVGPRPIVAAEVERYGAKFEDYRVCRPGLTGLWQVSGRSDCSYDDRIRYDSAYVNDWSFWLDMKIIAKTIYVVLARKGSY
jgi:exopolysaccharide production protein ExoY